MLSATSFSAARFGRTQTFSSSGFASTDFPKKPPNLAPPVVVFQESIPPHPVETTSFWQHFKTWAASLFRPHGMRLPQSLYAQLKAIEAIQDEPLSANPQAIQKRNNALLKILQNTDLQSETVLRALTHALKANYWELKEADRDTLRQTTVGLWGFLQRRLHADTPVDQWTGFDEVSRLLRRTKNNALKTEILAALIHFDKPLPDRLQALLKPISKGKPFSPQKLAQAALKGSDSYYKALPYCNTLPSTLANAEIHFPGQPEPPPQQYRQTS